MFKENDSKNWNEGFENRSKEIMDVDGTNVRLSFLDKKVLYVHPVPIILFRKL